MTREAARTTDGPASIVALEQLFPAGKRLLDDDLILRIVPWSIRIWTIILAPAWLRDGMFWFFEKLTPGVWALFPCRKRYIQEKAEDAVSHRIRAVVNLGAGLDTLVFRSQVLASLPAWEVDQPVNVAAKRKGLERALGKWPDRVTQVAVDFDHEDLSQKLRNAGYEGNEPTLFVLEAVTQYLTEDGIASTFDFLSKAPTGSRLLFTYVKQSFLDGDDIGDLKMIYKSTVQKGIWHFGLNPETVADFLAPFGWEVVAHESSEEIAARYIPATGRTIRTMPIEPVVYAVKR
ncbi:MAG: SAM-dependent methyltransferase [Silicimonas sp.]|nr:SAM-dependent methyltransferase [Silicimonas sp.]